MRKLAIALAAVAALALAGCSGKSVLEGGTSVTAPIQNPVGKTELVAVESAYGVALAGAVNYRRYCYSKPVQQLPSACKNRRTVVLKLQDADRKAHGAVVAARRFVRDNPTISAVSAIGAARAAVADFQSVANSTGVK